MARYKIIALDMDGTLLKSDKSLDPDTIRDIGTAAGQGIEVIYCSGRGVMELDSFLSFERCPFHTETPDHYALVSYLIDLSVSQSSALMPLHSADGYQSS